MQTVFKIAALVLCLFGILAMLIGAPQYATSAFALAAVLLIDNLSEQIEKLKKP